MSIAPALAARRILAADAAQSGAAGEAVADALDVVSLLLAAAAGAGIGFVLAAVVSTAAKRVLRRAPIGSALVKRIRTPLYLAAMTWGAWLGLGWVLADTDLAKWSNGSLISSVSHLVLIIAIATMTWIAYAAAWVFEDAARLRQSADHGRARRFETQAQVVRRLIQVAVVIIGIVSILGTFSAARQAMGTLLASAGLISVIAGLAAQSTLGNVFAGIQLAFTDAIRVGDVVVANTARESGAIEEITLSYVVVRLWDERRLIVPSTYFTTNAFENWTRRAAAQLGTVEVQLDWAAPMPLIRAKVEEILASTDLWDGRTWNVQMTGSDTSTVTVRILVSAVNSGNLWDLRCYLREQIVAWIIEDEPWIRPANRAQPLEALKVPVASGRAKVAALAAELADIAADPGAGGEDGTDSRDEFDEAAQAVVDAGQDDEQAHAARMVASRRKFKRARRRAMSERMRELSEGRARESVGGGRGNAGLNTGRTQVITVGTLKRIVEGEAVGESSASGVAADGETRVLSVTATSGGRGERLFSGSPEADKRSEIFAGPGEEVLAEREAVAHRREAEARGRDHDRDAPEAD